MNNTYKIRIVLTIILLSGLLLRLYGMKFGLPYLYDPDEPNFSMRAYNILTNKDPNPHWFGHPGTTVIYLLSMLYSIIFIGGVSLGAFTNISDFKLLYFKDPTIFYLSGRLMFALFGVASILLLYAITARLFNRTTGLVAATIFALSPLHVFFSKLIRTDILMTFLVLIVFWFCLEILEKRTWKSYILAGFFSGLAIATKYPALIVVLVIVITYIFSHSRNDFRKLIISGFASVFGAFVGSPFLFLDFKKVLADIAIENRYTHVSYTGEGIIRNLMWYVQNPLLHALSPIGLILVVFGIILCIDSRKKEMWILLIFPLSFLCFISLMHLRWARWIIPVLPFLCVLIAQAFYWIIIWVEQHINFQAKKLVGFILVSTLVVTLLRADIIQGIEMSGKDTRTLAGEWILDHIPQRSRILVEKYAPHLPIERYTFLLVEHSGKLVEVDPKEIRNSVFDPPFRQIGKLKNIDAILEKNVEYIVFSNWYDRYLAERKRSADYAQIVVMYERIMKMGTKIYEVNPVSGINRGPSIRVYRMDIDIL